MMKDFKSYATLEDKILESSNQSQAHISERWKIVKNRLIVK